MNVEAGAADIRHVAIVGGGFSGAMLAARLAEAGVRSSLIDRSGVFGPGLAYSTPFEGHLLNVRADRMSAVEGRSGDFVDWLALNCPQHADPGGQLRRFECRVLVVRQNEYLGKPAFPEFLPA